MKSVRLRAYLAHFFIKDIPQVGNVLKHRHIATDPTAEHKVLLLPAHSSETSTKLHGLELLLPLMESGQLLSQLVVDLFKDSLGFVELLLCLTEFERHEHEDSHDHM